jgi:hypothetical protein
MELKLGRRKADHKTLGSFQMWCSRRTEKVSWTDHVKTEELQRVKEKRYILRTIKRRKANWFGHILHRNYLLKHVTQGKWGGGIEVMGRRGRRRKQLLDDMKETRMYCKLKQEAVGRTLWGTHFGGSMELT